LGAGKIEKVISHIFMIISKFCCLTDKNYSDEFDTVYAENGLIDCLGMYYLIN